MLLILKPCYTDYTLKYIPVGYIKARLQMWSSDNSHCIQELQIQITMTC